MTGVNNQAALTMYERSRFMFYDALRDKFEQGPRGDQKCKDWVNSLYLTNGEIRLEVELSTNNTIFSFGVTPNQSNTNGNTVFRTERRLPLQDSICITELQFWVWRPLDNSGTPAQDGTWSLLRSYGNTQDFTANAAQTIDSQLYSHGSFTFKRNNVVIVPYRGLANFWYKPQTQQTAALGAGSPGDQIRPVEDAQAVTVPNLVFIGSSNNEPQIVLPASLNVVDSFTRLVMIGKGPYAQNSTVVN